MPTLQDPVLIEALKHVARALREADVRFAVGGGLAAWARGGPPTEHDIDLVIAPDDVDAALRSCEGWALRTEVPPEGWLVKAYHGDVLIDLIFSPTGLIVDDALFERCDMLNVAAMPMPVLSADDVMTTKLFALTEHNLDYGPVLEYARSLREQIDWEELRERTRASPFAHAFFALVGELGLCRLDANREAGASRAQAAADATARNLAAPRAE